MYNLVKIPTQIICIVTASEHAAPDPSRVDAEKYCPIFRQLDNAVKVFLDESAIDFSE